MARYSLVFCACLLAVTVSGADPGDLRARAAKALGTPDPASIDYPNGVPPTPAEIALGRTLFFDPRLSATRSASCATCHNPDLGFGDGLAKGRGVMGRELPRHAPHLYNVAWAPVLFWDGRAASLEEQALGPIQAPGEMALDLPTLLVRLNAVAAYRREFTAVYGPGPVTADRLAGAIAAFERTLVVRHTAYDRWQTGDDRALGPEATRGLALFLGKADCIACHSGPNFSDSSFHNLGRKDADRGRAGIVPGAAGERAFKTPGLRNALLTAPYMHDGGEPTLEAVVRFYNRGGDVPTPDPLVKKLHLAEDEIRDLVAFMGALTEPLEIPRPEIPAD